VPHTLIRSSAFAGRMPHPAKQPMSHFRGYSFNEMEESDEDPDGEDKDLAWFFKKFHPGLHKTNQIAWCRTYANCLAAQIPKNRPKTYKKNKTK